MGMIINLWVRMSPIMELAVEGATQVPENSPSGGPGQRPGVVASSQYPRLNTLHTSTLELLRNFPERYRGYFDAGLWNCYLSGEEIGSFVLAREDLQSLVEAYPGNINVPGCWDYYTGEPIGGVGSPWFVFPADMVRENVVLGMGQGNRNFI